MACMIVLHRNHPCCPPATFYSRLNGRRRRPKTHRFTWSILERNSLARIAVMRPCWSSSTTRRRNLHGHFHLAYGHSLRHYRSPSMLPRGSKYTMAPHANPLCGNRKADCSYRIRDKSSTLLDMMSWLRELPASNIRPGALDHVSYGCA
jgi:hypothetical protein